ncbi:hypothetical protein M5K25_006857 [Dendrobium thyrsiflorum]|uniref:Protein kinase domain-containing protein n=1 Tax=Dendrobium thyrsiflorum TaxID=117978 RepID=A0ABD0VC95_DENTH
MTIYLLDEGSLICPMQGELFGGLRQVEPIDLPSHVISPLLSSLSFLPSHDSAAVDLLSDLFCRYCYIGYMDPEYVITQELTEKSDIYSYGVLLLELVTGRRAIQDGKNIIDWSQKFLSTDAKLHELVDPAIAIAFDFEQLQVVIEIIQWCTRREGRVRPSIKQVLRMLMECLDPVQDGYSGAMEHAGGIERKAGKTRTQRNELIAQSGDASKAEKPLQNLSTDPSEAENLKSFFFLLKKAENMESFFTILVKAENVDLRLVNTFLEPPRSQG